MKRNFFHPLLIGSARSKSCASFSAVRALLVTVLVFDAVSMVPALFAQSTVEQNSIEYPSKKELFRSDDKKQKSANEKKVQEITKRDTTASDRVDLQAPNVAFDQESQKIKGSSGVSMSGLGSRVQANEGTLNTESNDAELSGAVSLSTSIGTLEADRGTFNFATEQGEFDNARLQVEEGGYKLESEKLIKYGDESLQTYNTTFTTCNCESGRYPWSFFTSECDITKEGYAHAYGVTFRVLDVPIFYTPYLGFPAKVDRASGLLAPQLGYSRRTGMMYRQPVLGIIDNSNDVTFTPFIESKAREGLFFDYGGAYSTTNSLKLRALYSDESLRDPLSDAETRAAAGDPQGKNDLGTIIGRLDDPFFDDQRTGLNLEQRWTHRAGEDASFGLYSNVRYLSDDLVLREMQDSELGDRQEQFSYSTVAARTTIGDLVSAEVMGDYTQLLVGDDNLQFQHLPTATVDVGQTFRPFGQNPYGLKLVTSAQANYTDFTRDVGFEGSRFNLAPSVTVPVRYENYVSTAFQFSLDQTQYRLRDRTNPSSDPTQRQEIYSDDSTDRTLPRFAFTAGNAFERVFAVDKQSWLVAMTSLGSESQTQYLARIKNTIEPFVNYSYIPDVDQEENPQFDEFDQLGERSLVTYGVKSSIYGRFLPTLDSASDIPELDQTAENLPMIGIDPATGIASSPGAGVRRGTIRELARFSLYQGYDIAEKENQGTEDDDPLRRPYTDVTMAFDVFPTRYFGVQWGSNIDSYDNEFSSWNLGSSLRTDRGDRLRVRATYQRDPATNQTSLSQVEGSAEIKVNDPFRLGYYTRYDQKEKEFIENKVALRFIPGCDCWYFDVGYLETVNPDKETFMLSFTLLGLGNVSQDLLTYKDKEEIQ